MRAGVAIFLRRVRAGAADPTSPTISCISTKVSARRQARCSGRRPPKGARCVAAVGGDESPEFVRQSRDTSPPLGPPGLDTECIVSPPPTTSRGRDALTDPKKRTFTAVATFALQVARQLREQPRSACRLAAPPDFGRGAFAAVRRTVSSFRRTSRLRAGAASLAGTTIREAVAIVVSDDVIAAGVRIFGPSISKWLAARHTAIDGIERALARHQHDRNEARDAGRQEPP